MQLNNESLMSSFNILDIFLGYIFLTPGPAGSEKYMQRAKYLFASYVKSLKKWYVLIGNNLDISFRLPAFLKNCQ